MQTTPIVNSKSYTIVTIGFFFFPRRKAISKCYATKPKHLET